MSSVSIIIPTYNRADFLPRCIESALAQSQIVTEIVIIDDGSTDNTPEVVSEYESSRLRYIRKEKNKNANVARNIGIRKSSSEFILFLDSDDELLPDAASTLAMALDSKSKQYAAVFPSYTIVDEDSESLRPTATGKVTFEDLVDENVIGGFTGNLVRRSVFEAIGYLDEDLEKGQDVDFYFRVLKDYYMWGIEDELYRQYYHGDQISTDESRRIDGETQMLQKHGEYLSPAHRARRYDWRGMAYAYSGQMRAARKDFRKALRSDPTKWEYYYHYVLSWFGGRIFVKGTPRYR